MEPSLFVEYKTSHVRQYFKEPHALHTETAINNPEDFYLRKAVTNLPFLRRLGEAVNRRLREAERVSHHCSLTQGALDRLQRPTLGMDNASPPCASAIRGSWPPARP